MSRCRHDTTGRARSGSNSRRIRQEPTRQIEAIPLRPNGKGTLICYNGVSKPQGGRECAEGQNRTAYAGLFRAALYR